MDEISYREIPLQGRSSLFGYTRRKCAELVCGIFYSGGGRLISPFTQILQHDF